MAYIGTVNYIIFPIVQQLFESFPSLLLFNSWCLSNATSIRLPFDVCTSTRHVNKRDDPLYMCRRDECRGEKQGQGRC